MKNSTSTYIIGEIGQNHNPLWIATQPAPIAANAADAARRTWTAWAAAALALIVLVAALFS